MQKNNSTEEEKLFSGVFRFNAEILGLVLGVLTGTTIFVMTNWLVIKGASINTEGEYVIGPHLQLLSEYFIGYRVSFLGSIIGFFYAFAVGTISGAIIGYMYNFIVNCRNSKKQ